MQPKLPMELHVQEAPNVERVRELVRDWCEKNPYKHYTSSYDDQIPSEWLQLLLDGEFEKFDEKMWSAEIDMSHYTDSTETFKEMIKEIGDDIDPNFEVDEEHDLFEIIEDTFRDSFIEDWSEYWDGCWSNTGRGTKTGVTAMLFWPDSEAKYQDDGVVEFPCHSCGDEENTARCELLKDFIKDPSAAELVYEHETLKICGQLDFHEIYKKQKVPTHIVIGPRDSRNALCHSSWGGSGCMGSIEITAERKFKAWFRLDSTNRYGVQEVYGFVGSWWDHDLQVEYEDEKV